MTKAFKLQTKKDLHIARKIWHICGVSFLIWLYLSLPYKSLLIFGSFATSFIVLIDVARLYSPKLNSLIQKCFWFCMREGEKKQLTGMSYMAIGAMALAFLFPKEIVVLSLIFLGIGDPIASTFGILYGKNRIGSKSLEGSLAAFVACTVASVIYYIYHGFFDHRIFLAVPLSGLWGALAELVQIKYLDDNFTLPVLSGIGLMGVFYILGA